MAYKVTHREYKLGIELTPEEQEVCLAKFVHRFTKEHVPQWAKVPDPDGEVRKPHFASDRDWLEHTHFVVNDDGSLDETVGRCSSLPTWPDGQ